MSFKIDLIDGDILPPYGLPVEVFGINGYDSRSVEVLCHDPDLGDYYYPSIRFPCSAYPWRFLGKVV